MNRKSFNVLMIVALLSGLVAVLPAGAYAPAEDVAVAAPAARPAAQFEPPRGLQPVYYRDDIIDINAALEAKDLPIDWSGAPEQTIQAQVFATPTYGVGDTLRWLALDNYRGTYFWTNYTVFTITEHSEIWVQEDLGYYNLDGSPNYTHPDFKDPESVAPDKLNYLSGAFDDQIYPIDTQYFGTPEDRDGTTGLLAPRFNTDDGSRIVILVSNVRDGNYYDPVNYGSFIIGFRSGTYERYSGRLMITIDSKDWDMRVGNGLNPTYAYDYDNTLAHELQHMIQGQLSPGEPTWLNEGLSGLAEFLNGYWFTGNLGGRTQWQLWPQNSLTWWDDQEDDTPEHGKVGTETLADYQLTNAFLLYTIGRLGGDETAYAAVAAIAQTPETGMAAFDQQLDAIVPGLTFATLFNDFRKDMLYGGYTDGAQPVANWNGNWIGDYASPIEAIRPTVPMYLGLLRDNLDREGYDWPGIPPDGTSFIEVCLNADSAATPQLPVFFDGDESVPGANWAPIAAADVYTPSGNVAGDVLFSGYPHGTDNFVIYGPITVAAGDALSFDHYYNTEEGWDFGFVQVTTDTSGFGWTSLDITGMTTETVTSWPVMQNNVPGFTSFSDGWQAVTHDLSDYAGQDILLAFRFSADSNTVGISGYTSGWAIDNVMVGATTLTTGTLNGGRSIQEVRDMRASFIVEFLTWNGDDVANVYTAMLDPATLGGLLDLAPAALGDPNFSQPGDRGVLMLTAHAPSYADLIGGGAAAEYPSYKLVGLPASICTSDLDAWGSTHMGTLMGNNTVYAGQPVTASVHVDNIGSSPNITPSYVANVNVGVEVPANTTYNSTTAGMYTDDLSSVDGSFPAVPGVYWSGPVNRTYDFDVVFDVDAGLAGPVFPANLITATVHFAGGQYEVVQDVVHVITALSLSGLAPDVEPVAPGGVATFTASLINMSPAPKPIQLVADHPADTTFIGVTGATVVATSTTQVTVTQEVSPYADSGIVGVTFQWQLGSSYTDGDKVVSEMVLEDTTTGETFDLSAETTVGVLVSIPTGGFSVSPTEVNIGKDVTFQVTVNPSATRPVNVVFDFGDGESATGVINGQASALALLQNSLSATHAYTAAGTYTATVTATNVWNTASAEAVITVLEGYQIFLPIVLKNK